MIIKYSNYLNRVSLYDREGNISTDLMDFLVSQGYIDPPEDISQAECEHCNEPFHCVDDIPLCKKCMRTHYYCSDCGTLHLRHNMFMYETRYICATCLGIDSIEDITNVNTEKYFYCGICHILHRKAKSTSHFISGSEIYICDNCFESSNGRIYECSICSKTYDSGRNEKFLNTDTIKVICNHCSTSIRKEAVFRITPDMTSYRTLRNVRGYHDRPALQFNKTEAVQEATEKSFMGIELELELNESLVPVVHHVINENTSNLWASRDGSISTGLEFISHPCTLAYYKENPFLKSFIDNIAPCVSTARRRQGLHIHISKAGFEDRHHILLQTLIYGNRNLWIDFAGRDNPQYAKLYTCNNIHEMVNIGFSGRYCALNFGTGLSTIEYRLYDGVCEYDYIIACLEATHSTKAFIEHYFNTVLKADYKGYSMGYINSLHEKLGSFRNTNPLLREYYDYLTENKEKYPLCYERITTIGEKLCVL